jgi:hypothetical protein
MLTILTGRVMVDVMGNGFCAETLRVLVEIMLTAPMVITGRGVETATESV